MKVVELPVVAEVGIACKDTHRMTSKGYKEEDAEFEEHFWGLFLLECVVNETSGYGVYYCEYWEKRYIISLAERAFRRNLFIRCGGKV